MNTFAPSTHQASTPAPAFNPYLASASKTTQASPAASATGTMRADQWSQMGKTDVQNWINGLTGKHVDATDATGRTISGMVSGMQQLGNTVALNVGGHLVSLSQLKQISWSPAVT
jgi:hypothetical protein